MAAADLIPFDDRDGFIWLDGKLVPWREAKLHVLSHGLHYASSVFEGERVYGGQIFKLTEHSQRLVDSATLLDMKLPWTTADIDAATREVVRANSAGDAYVRPIVWRGSEVMGVTAQAAKPRLAIATWAWPSYFSPEARNKGIRLTMSQWARPAPNTAPTKAKATGLYMICTLSKHAAERAGFDDALMLDWRGLIAESTGANIFLVIDGEIHTPAPDCFLDGITRRTVIGLARARGYRIIERHIPLADLERTQEVFLTGTAAEVTPVGEIEGRTFTVGTITHTLMDDFTALTRGRLETNATAA
ncbi:MAG TPA: branched-chain amino acid aminotransferase [Candidatus Sulfotelmatobacter sp.]|nr:branched-chain amino acid aminotransferase [Candidatus Sulfotelmatobacter sp.]